MVQFGSEIVPKLLPHRFQSAARALPNRFSVTGQSLEHRFHTASKWLPNPSTVAAQTLGPPGASWGFLGPPWAWMLSGASWDLLGPPGASWGFLGPGCLLGPPRPSWGVLGPSWGLLGPPGPSWALLGPGCFLGSPGASWALLGPPGASYKHIRKNTRMRAPGEGTSIGTYVKTRGCAPLERAHL